MSGEASQLTSNGCLLWSVGAVEGAEPFSVLLGGHGASQQWGDPLEKRQDPRLTPTGLRVTLHPQQPLPSSQVRRVKTILISGCSGTSGHCPNPTPCPPSPSQDLFTETALNQHWVQHPMFPRHNSALSPQKPGSYQHAPGPEASVTKGLHYLVSSGSSSMKPDSHRGQM